MHLPGYDDVSEYEQQLFRKALHRLLFEGSLQLNAPADRDDYLLLQQHHHAAEAILFLFQTRPILDAKHDLMYFEPIDDPDAYARLTTKDELTLLMILRNYIETQYQSQGETTAAITVGEIFRLYETEWSQTLSRNRGKQILRNLKRLKIIHYSDSLDQDDTSLTILPMLFVLTPERLIQMAEALHGNGVENAPSSAEEVE